MCWCLLLNGLQAGQSSHLKWRILSWKRVDWRIRIVNRVKWRVLWCIRFLRRWGIFWGWFVKRDWAKMWASFFIKRQLISGQGYQEHKELHAYIYKFQRLGEPELPTASVQPNWDNRQKCDWERRAVIEGEIEIERNPLSECEVCKIRQAVLLRDKK